MSLPLDIWYQIFSRSAENDKDLKNILSICRTCKLFRYVMYYKNVWAKRLQNFFKIPPPSLTLQGNSSDGSAPPGSSTNGPNGSISGNLPYYIRIDFSGKDSHKFHTADEDGFPNLSDPIIDQQPQSINPMSLEHNIYVYYLKYSTKLRDYPTFGMSKCYACKFYFSEGSHYLNKQIESASGIPMHLFLIGLSKERTIIFENILFGNSIGYNPGHGYFGAEIFLESYMLIVRNLTIMPPSHIPDYIPDHGLCVLGASFGLIAKDLIIKGWKSGITSAHHGRAWIRNCKITKCDQATFTFESFCDIESNEISECKEGIVLFSKTPYKRFKIISNVLKKI